MSPGPVHVHQTAKILLMASLAAHIQTCECTDVHTAGCLRTTTLNSFLMCLQRPLYLRLSSFNKVVLCWADIHTHKPFPIFFSPYHSQTFTQILSHTPHPAIHRSGPAGIKRDGGRKVGTGNKVRAVSDSG